MSLFQRSPNLFRVSLASCPAWSYLFWRGSKDEKGLRKADTGEASAARDYYRVLHRQPLRVIACKTLRQNKNASSLATDRS
jgi:hypothetical protein